jgi:hypothetical protein
MEWIPLKQVIEQEIAEAESRRQSWTPEYLQPDTTIPEITIPESVVTETSYKPPTVIPEVVQRPTIPTPKTTDETPIEIATPVEIATPEMPKIETPKAWEQPAVMAEKATEAIGTAISKVPVLPKILRWASPVFEFLGNVDKTWGAIITQSASPALEWKEGEDWLEHQRREYENWESPTYLKGTLEFFNPVWWIPWAGWAAKATKVIGVSGKALKTVQTGAKVLETIGLSGDIGGFKSAEKVAKAAAEKSSLLTSGKLTLPSSSQITEALFTGDNASRLAEYAEKSSVLKPIKKLINDAGDIPDRIILASDINTRKLVPKYANKMVDGQQVAASIKNYVKQQEVVYATTRQIADDNIKSLLMPQVQRYGNAVRLMQADGYGLTKVKALKDVGTGTVDIAANFINKTEVIDNLYSGLSDEAKEYLLAVRQVAIKYDQLLVDEFRDDAIAKVGANADEEIIVREARRLAGVNPDEILLPRIVLGKETPNGYEEITRGIKSELQRVHKTMNEGVGVDKALGYSIKYDNNLNHNLERFISNYAKKIADHRFAKAIEPLGKTLKESMLSYEPEFMERLSKSAVTVSDLSYTKNTIDKFLSCMGIQSRFYNAQNTGFSLRSTKG